MPRCRRAPGSGSSGSPARTSSPLPVRAAHTSATRSARSRRTTNPEDLRRGVVEPLRVVDDADQRLLLGDLGEQRQRGEPHQEPVGWRTGAPAEDCRERVALRHGQPVEVVEHVRAELMEAAVGELHLGLDPDGPRDVPAGDPVGHVAQQRALAHARLSAQDDDSAPTGERVGQEPVECLTFSTTSEEPHRRPPAGRAYTSRTPKVRTRAWRTRGATRSHPGATRRSGRERLHEATGGKIAT